ncbi:MAG: efflux RND transporter periplasmic adaptor subunit [Phycisphaerae bacterium]|nr:efflux RND transporter periplasmic adaptor subunit [Phycisphaerae bacterium]
MTAATNDLRSLSRSSAPSIPKPRLRIGARVVLPLSILLVATALIAYAARAAFMPTIDVWVVPVVATSDTAPASAGPHESPPSVLVQAPGWVEPNPYAVTVQALAEGVLSEVLVLEGEPVEADQVVARMIDSDARLAVRRTDADFEAQRAELDRAEAELKAAEARAAEVRDEAHRKKPLAESGGISEGQLARLELRLAAAEREVEAARAAVAAVAAQVKSHRVLCDEARLRFNRMEIRSPTAGLVLQRLVEPGTRISMNAPAGDGPSMGILRLYNPDRLQVRVDVPLADASKISLGTAAEIETEAIPNTTFKGEVIRIVPEANIQRNTVQFKVAIAEPTRDLKPEMLARVRFVSRGGHADTAAGSSPVASAPITIEASRLIAESEGTGKVWIVDLSHGTTGPVALSRAVTFARSNTADRVQVLTGLNPGDRLIADPPPTLRDNTRIKILGEKTEARP